MPRPVLHRGQQCWKVLPAWYEQGEAAQCHRSASGGSIWDRVSLFHPLETVWVVCLLFALQSFLRRCIFVHVSALFFLSFMTLPASSGGRQESKKATGREEPRKRKRRCRYETTVK